MAPLTKQERQCLKRIMKRYPKMPREEAQRRARRMVEAKEAALKGYPTQSEVQAPDPKTTILDSMSLPEKATMAAGVWGLKRWFRREVMPELVKQPTLVPTRKMSAVAGGGLVATLIAWAAAKWLGVEIGPEEAALFAAAIATVAGYFTREKRVPQSPPEEESGP